MADAVYKDYPFLMKSRGIVARLVDDTVSMESLLNADNCEEIYENAWGQRLGSTIFNSGGGIGSTVYPLTGRVSVTGFPTAAANQGVFPGGNWANPSFIFGSGSNFATVTVNNAGNTPSNQLLASAIAPTIPAGKTVLGFSVKVNAVQTNVFGVANNVTVQLALFGAPVGTPKTLVPGSSAAVGLLGGKGDMWGTTLTAAQIIAGLGIIFQGVAGSSASTTISLNECEITIYYTDISPVVSLSKLGGLNGAYYRYGVTAGGTLWRRPSINPGPYTLISAALSGSPIFMVSNTSDYSGNPYMFFADANGMFKDNGVLTAPQQMGIFQPQYPVAAQSQEPTTLVTLDNYTGVIGDYTFTGIGGGTLGGNVATTTTSPIAGTGIQEVNVADPTQVGLFQLLTIDAGGNSETVLVLLLTTTGFIAKFTKAHLSGVTVTNLDLSVTVPASTTATVSKSFGGKPIPVSETVWGNQADYIGLYMFVSDATQIQSITLKFDCGDGTFQTDYFYKVLAQGPLQDLVSTATTQTDPTTALTDAILSESLNLYGNQPGGIGGLNTGLNVWTPLLFQLSDFAGTGRADFSDPVFNWANVNGYQIEIVTNDQSSVVIDLACLVLFGGAGPDSLGGVAYDYAFTLFNPVDGTESNPCPFMTNQNPPNATNWVYPRRQPVLLTMNLNNYDANGQNQDPQVGMIRVYRKGGSLGDAYRKLDQVVVNNLAGGNFTYLDTTPDYLLQGADILSLTHDVPVTSTLQVPVNTTIAIGHAINTRNQEVSVYPASMANISVRQQVSLGTPTAIANNFEIVIVTAIFSDHFRAFVQNTHAEGEQVQATAQIGVPCTIMEEAYGQFWFAGDKNNPNTIYFSERNNPQYIGSASYKQVSQPDDIITAVKKYKGNLYIGTIKGGWWAVAPGSNGNNSPTIYPTACKFGPVSPQGVVATEEAIFYQASDGNRAFSGGASSYLTLDQEFIYQGIGDTPIVKADQTQLSQTFAAYWNNYLFFSYIGVDTSRHRLMFHTQYKRWRNDDVDAQCLFLEEDTKELFYGDSNGLVHIDRQPIFYDEVNNAGVVAKGNIAINLQSSYQNQSAPDFQKNYVELQLDTNTGGQNIQVNLLFNDGEIVQPIGTVNTSQRQKTNFTLNGDKGYQAYKVALQLTGALNALAVIYQGAIRATVLAKTRTAFDTYKLNLGVDTSKIAKNIFFDYNSTDPINMTVEYDDGLFVFPFTLPATGGVRNVERVRLPGELSFRLIRVSGSGPSDFQIWNGSRIEWKEICAGKGYMVAEFAPN